VKIFIIHKLDKSLSIVKFYQISFKGTSFEEILFELSKITLIWKIEFEPILTL